jgi:argininosuccinate lyase
VSVVMGYQQMTKDIAKNLPSGYNRDLQLLKRPVIHSTEIALQSIEVARLYLTGITPKQASIERKISKDIFMADVALALSKEKGIPFREAYLLSQKHMKAYEVDFKKNIASKVSPGAPGNLQWQAYKKRIAVLKRLIR